MMLKRFVALVMGLAVVTALPWLVTPDVNAGAEQSQMSRDGDANKASFTVDDFEEIERPEIEDLRPRKKMPKRPDAQLRIRPEESGRLIVKFDDAVRARPAPVRGQILSRAGRDVRSFQDIVEAFDLEVEPAIKMSEQRMANVETRAALQSGKAQPDLAGLMYVSGPRHNMEQAARAINRLNNVEFVEVEPAYGTYNQDGTSQLLGGNAAALQSQRSNRTADSPAPEGGAGAGIGAPLGACCIEGVCQGFVTETQCDDTGGNYLGDGTCCTSTTCVPGACCDGNDCDELLEIECLDAGGNFYGAGTECGDAGCADGNCCMDETCAPMANQFECQQAGGTFIGGTSCGADPEDNPCDGEADCGELGAGPCFFAHGSPYCDDEDCCELVGEVYPPCSELGGEWDELCVAIAHLVCEQDAGADRCFSVFNDGCLESHPGPGCNGTDCCKAVCEVREICCTNVWDETCTQLAWDLCVHEQFDVETPDFTQQQGYRWGQPYAQMPDGVPCLPFDHNGYGAGGDGFSLMSPYHPDDPNFDPYAGLYGMARELLEEYGVGQELVDDGTLHPVWAGGRGASIKVGVVEWAYYEDHEDLDVTTVLPEGDEMIMIPDVTSPDHGTASLGIISALENDFGMTGVAPDAEAYFFPITSVQQGPRPLTAITEAIELFGPGDVLSFSFGPAPENLNTRETTNMLFALASDAGITCAIAAGNSCFNLDNVALADLPDSGAIVVGACTPGYPWGRLSFSNYYREGSIVTDANVVHMSAWGSNVASLGYGDLFLPDGDYNRSYTMTYGGTSAAAPQVAALAACLQSFAKQFYGIPLSVQKVRGMALNYQNDIENPDDRPALEEENGRACGPDLDFESGGGANNITGYPAARASGGNIISQEGQGFDQSLEIEEVHTIRGDWLGGNVFSVSAEDSIYYELRSETTSVNSKPSNIPSDWRRPLSSVGYITNGQVADVFAVAKPFQLEEVWNFSVEVVADGLNRPSVAFLELYDWNQRRWVITSVSTQGAGGEIRLFHDSLFGIQQYVGPGNRTLIRFWVYGFPVSGSFGSGNINPPFDMRLDGILYEATGSLVPHDDD